MNPFNEIDQNDPNAQGSEAWKKIRMSGVGGSEIAVVLGISPHKTRYQLWLEKTNLQAPVDISNLPHVQRGVLAEPIARKLMEEREGMTFKPTVWPQKGVARCSDDGSNIEHGVLLEIKCMGIANHQKAHMGEIPDYYLVQCIWNLGVSEMNECLFVSIRPEEDNDLAVVKVHPNNERYSEMLFEAKKFMELVRTKTPPELVDKDYVHIESELLIASLEAYKKAKAAAKLAELECDRLKDEILAQVPNGSVVVGGNRITRFFKKGNVDFAKIPQLKDVNLEPYRKAGSIQTLITLSKES